MKQQPAVKAPAETFTGDAWPAHAVGQTVHVTEGIGRIQSPVTDAEYNEPPAT